MDDKKQKLISASKGASRALLELNNAPVVIANSLSGIAERISMGIMDRAALLAAVKLIERDILKEEIVTIQVLDKAYCKFPLPEEHKNKEFT